MCYIINENDIDNFMNIDKAERDEIVLAKSQPLVVDSSKGMHLDSFRFYDGEKLPLLSQKDSVSNTVRYCAIIEALDADSVNYYELTFLQHKYADGSKGDLQLNNRTYNFLQKDTSNGSLGSGKALITDDQINNADLYYGITVLEAIEEGYLPFNDGIYTAKFSTTHPVSKLRLTMRINREGIYEAEETKDVMKGEPLNAIGIEAEDLKAKGFKFSEGRYVAVGTNFRRVRSVIGDSLYFDEGVHAEIGDPIYPINYGITIKGTYNVWNPETCRMEERDYVFSDMKLVAILPDQVHPAPSASDRLVFETEFWDEEAEETSQVPVPRKFNDFEVQIHWEKSANELGSRVNAKIYSLNISADRSF